MNAQDVPDERLGPETEIDETAGDAGKVPVQPNVSPAPTADHDTEGQGGKVFALDGSDAEDSGRP